MSLGQGTTGTTTVIVNPQYGFTGSVNLSVTGLPSGVTASFSPNPTIGSSTLTLTAAGTAPVGPTTLTITGTSGSVTATTTLALSVSAPSFTLSDYSSVSLGQGSSGTSYVYVTPQYGFTGSVNLAVTGLPSGVSASFSPNPTTGNATLTLTATSAATLGAATLTITGTSGSLTATTTLPLTVSAPSFTLSASSVTIGQGATATSYVYVNSQYGFNGSVNLAVTGLPSGVTAAFAPNPATGSSLLTLTASSTAATGQYSATITGTSGSVAVSTVLNLTVSVPGFTLSDYSSVAVGQGSSATSYVYVYPQNGFAGSVNLAVTGLPSGVTAAFAPNPATGSSLLTLTASSTAALGQYSLTITGTSGSLTASTTLSLLVEVSSFTVSAGSVSIGQGSSGTSYVYVNSQTGFSGSVRLAVTGLPNGVTASFAPNPTSTGSSTLTLTASSSASPATSTLTITGTSGTLTASTTLSLTVSVSSFTLSDYSGSSIGQGSSGTSTVFINAQYGFTGGVTLAVTGLPSGVTASFTPNPATGSSTLTLTASSTASLGQFNATITGTSGSLTATTNINVIVFAPSFTLSASSVSIGLGGSGSSTVYINPQYGFSGSVRLTATGLPSGVTAFFGTNPATGSSALTLTASSTASLGQYNVTITGTSGNLTSITTVGLTVSAPSFTLSDTSAGSLGQAGSSTSYVYITPQYGFAGSVSLSVTGLPSGVTASFSPNPGSGAYSILTLTASSTASLGQYNLTITGISGNLTASTIANVTIYAPSFTLSNYNSVTIGQGSSTTSYVYVYPQYGFTGSVSLGVTGLPSGVTASFAPNPIPTGSSLLTLRASTTASLGQYTATITGTSGSVTVSTPLSLGVYAPSFTLSDSYSVAINQGASGTASVYVSPQYGFTGSVSLAASGLPSGVTASFAPNPTTGSSVMTLTAANPATPGTFTVTITGVSGNITATTTMSLTVYPQSFTLTDAPTAVTLAQSGSRESTVYVVPQYGFAGTVSLAASGLPSGVTASFTPNPATGSSMLTLTAGSTAAIGPATITITGTSGALTATTTLALTIAAPPAITSTTLTVTSAGTPVRSVVSGSVVALTAAVSAGSRPLTTGQVRFCDASASYCEDIHLLGTAQLTSAGTAVLKFIPGMGSHSYKTVFAGTQSNASSSSSAAALTVTAAIASTTAVAHSGVPGNYTLTGTVTAQGSLSPTGNISFQDTSSGNAVVGTAALGQGATALNWRASSPPATGSSPYRIATGDFNGDGILDLAVANSASSTATILLGKGDGTFKASAVSPQTGSYPLSIAVGDFNGDGAADLAVANSGSNTVTHPAGQWGWDIYPGGKPFE